MEFLENIISSLNSGKFQEVIESIGDFLDKNPAYKTIDYYHFANPLEELGKTYFSFFVDNPNYYHFLFGEANISLDLTKNADSEKNYRPYEIFKELVNQVLIANKIKAARRNDVVISLWAYIHGLTSLATMKNVKYDCNWKSKLHDFITIFNCKELGKC